MPTQALPQKYDKTQIRLHWLIALMIFGLYAVGLGVDLFAKPVRPFIVNLHAIFGLTLLLLLVLRIVWRLTHPKPDYPAGMGPWFRKIANAGHGLLYLLMALVPIIGLRALLFRGRPLNLGLAQIPMPFAADHDIAHSTTELHGLMAHVLIAVAVGHILVALYHQFALRDGLLLRMRPR